MAKSFMKASCLALSAVLLLGSSARLALGQEVRGRITSQDSQEPVTGVFVMLIDSTGVRAAAALTDTAGIYRVRTRIAGTYTVTAERLGYTSSTSAPFALHPDAVVIQDLSLAINPIVLPDLNVRPGQRCEAPRDRAARTAQLWEEARKALTVASWAAAEQLVTYEFVRYSRELVDDGKRVLRDHVEQRAHRVVGSPWEIPEPDDLVANGFMQPRSDGMTDVFVPGAEVLLSPEFLGSHCFELRADRQNPDRIGLGFRPIGRPTKPDVVGTLWLDRSSLALQSIEYEYRQFERARARTLGSGSVDFAYVRSGLWVMGSWLARLFIQPTNARRGQSLSLVEDGTLVVRALASDSSVIWTAPPHRRLTTANPVSTDSALDAESGTAELPILSAAGLAAWACGPRDRKAERTTEVLGVIGTTDGHALQNVPIRLAWVEQEAVQSRDTTTDAAGVYIFCGIPLERDVALSFAISGRGTRAVMLRTHRGVILTRSFFLR